MELIKAGRALYLKGNPGFAEAHLWFVISESNPESGLVVIVPLVTERPHTDRTVVLEQGDHPFIKHRSNIDYGATKFCRSTKLAAAVSAGRCQLLEDLSRDLLDRVRAGACASARVPNDVAAYCRKAFGR